MTRETPRSMIGATVSYRWVDHTSELELRIDAPSEEAVFELAVTAMGELVREGDEPIGDTPARVARAIEVVAADRATLLAALLEELVYLIETDDLIPERAEDVKLVGEGLIAVVYGHRGSPRHLVKGVTYNELTFAPVDDGFVATVVLDV